MPSVTTLFTTAVVLLVWRLDFIYSKSLDSKMPTRKLDNTVKPLRGPYNMTNVTLINQRMDSSDLRVDVYFPVTGGNGSFPLIAFAHGLKNRPTDYLQLFSGIVSFGYVVVVPWACYVGCKDDTSTLPFDPPGFRNYYKQQLLALDWAFASAVAGNTSALMKINTSSPAGISGHSMGGQSTLFSSSYSNASNHKVAAAVMHHAYTHEYPAPLVPFLAFTGKEDLIAPASMTEHFFTSEGASTSKGFVYKTFADHFECEDPFPGQFPPDAYNPLMPQYTAAWFKMHVEGKSHEFGIDFESMIYGICNGDDGHMETCNIQV